MKSVIVLVIALFNCTLALESEKALQQFTTGNNWFTGAVYKEILKSNNGNFLVCPFSAEIILALAQSGAKDETAEEIRTSLRLPNSTEEIQSAFAALIPSLHNDKYYTFYSANKIYVKKNYSIKEEFTRIATDVYKATSENIDFSQKIKAAEIMNEWVANRTGNKIRDLFDQDNLGDETRAVLINALYFKGEWKRLFKGRSTKKNNFYRTADDVVQVDTMHKKEYYGYYESEELNAQFLEMPFKGHNVSLVIVLPKDKDGLAALEDQVDKVFVSPSFTWELVHVALPKFKIETQIDFKEILTNLGVNKAFTRADFSGIAGEKGDIYITNVMQKSFISINEKGVEAAAATAVFLHPKSLVEFYGEHKSFIADHPFIFYIKTNNIVLFAGRVLSP